ncbi:unnamed protein product, partial [Closterium sp. Naga37s-1]
MALPCRGATPCLLVSLLLLSLTVLRIHARHGPEITVADAAKPHSRSGIPTGDRVAISHRRQAQSPEVGASGERQHDASASSSRGGGTARTTGAGSNDGAVESIAEWKRRSAEAGAHYFPLQRAEDAPSRDELHRRILVSNGGRAGGLRAAQEVAARVMGEGLKDKGKSGKASQVRERTLDRRCHYYFTDWNRLVSSHMGCLSHLPACWSLACITACVQRKGYPLPLMAYDSTLLSTANGTMGNTMVNYSTFSSSIVEDYNFHLPVYPYYVALKLGSQKQEFSMALNLAVPDTFVPCDCLHCASMCKGTTTSKPFSTLASTTLKYISCKNQRCQTGMDTKYGCNTEGYRNYINTTGFLPGDDALCVYSGWEGPFDYYEADGNADVYLQSLGHVMEDTVYLTAPDGTEVNRSIILGCGMYQQGYWGMQGWQYGSWAAGGVLGLGWNSPFLYQLTGLNEPSALAVCLEATPTNETGWDGKVPLKTGSSHLTIGATGLPAGASYATLLQKTGMQYSHITLTTPTRALNITDDRTKTGGSPYLPDDFPENATPGFLFMPESFVHMLRYPLLSDLLDKSGEPSALAGRRADAQPGEGSNENKEVDPFTTFPTIDIAFFLSRQHHLPLLSQAARVPRPGFAFRRILHSGHISSQRIELRQLHW